MLNERKKKALQELKLEYRDVNDNVMSLFYEEVNLNEILKKYKTPIYVYSKNRIVRNCNNFVKAFCDVKIKNFQICYAMKACSNLSILKLISSLGFGVDVVSKGEIEKAIFAGFSAKSIVFSGVGKTTEELVFAIKNGVGQINIESIEELQEVIKIANEMKIKANVALRVNPSIKAHTNKKISTGHYVNKFGIEVNKIDDIVKTYGKQKYISIVGLTIHIGSQITNANDFDRAFSCMKKIYKFYPEFTTIDLGGGLGINYDLKSSCLSVQDYVAIIKKYFSGFSGKIIIEMGRSIIGDAGIFLTRIIRVKYTSAKKFIIIDGGMNNLIRPALYEAWHEPLLVNLSTKKRKGIEKKKERYDIVGPICESSDVFNENVFFKKNDLLENCIVFTCAGAYCRSMSSDYNLQGIAGEVLIDGKNVVEIAKRIDWKKLTTISER